MSSKPANLPLNNLTPQQRQAFQTHLDDLWDDYQDALAAYRAWRGAGFAGWREAAADEQRDADKDREERRARSGADQLFMALDQPEGDILPDTERIEERAAHPADRHRQPSATNDTDESGARQRRRNFRRASSRAIS